MLRFRRWREHNTRGTPERAPAALCDADLGDGWIGPVDRPFPAHALGVRAVVYAICARNRDRRIVLYVGQTTGRLVERIGAHFGRCGQIQGLSGYLMPPWRITVSYLAVPGALDDADMARVTFGRRSSSLLIAAERAWIRRLRPTLNRTETCKCGAIVGGAAC